MEHLQDLEPEELKVSRITSKQVVRDFVLDYAQRLGWIPGKMDHELFWVAGPEGAGMYVGELNGELITGVVMVQLNSTYGWVGSYFCEEKYRGKGYAFKTWKIARAAINPQVNLGLDSMVSSVPLYEREGFKKAWAHSLYYFFVSSILKAYDTMITPVGITVTQATEVDFVKLRSYTEDVIGVTFDHAGLLEKWISLPTHIALAAVNESGDIVGFAAIRETINCDKSGYRLAPLLADSGDIARLLLLQLAKAVTSVQKFGIYVLSEINPEAKKIQAEVNGEKYLDSVRMFTKGEPPMKKEKYFGVFSDQLVG